MKEKFFILILAFLSAIAPLATDMYLPALSLVQHSFNTSEFYTQLSIASFFIAFALGQLLYGPISDIYGRKIPLIIGLFIFIISSFLCFLVDNIYTFIALRFMQALGGCAGVVIARAIVNDCFSKQKAVAVFSLMMISSSIAPMISPSIGGLLLKYFSWQSIFITLFCLGILLLFLSIFYIKESNKNQIPFSFSNIYKAYKSVLTNKSFLIYVISSSLIMSTLFAYISGSSFVFTNVFNISLQEYGLIFGINSLGFMITARLNVYFTSKFGISKVIFIACITMIINSFCLILLSNNFYTFTLFLFLTLCMLGFITPNLVTKAMQKSKKYSGSASAILGAMQFMFAGFAAFLVGAMNANTSFALACIISIFCLLASLVYILRFKLIRI
ncbi:multidrug effflux MFS transporter [Campylobacter sp. RM12651]|uniref:multidrug effflux MFS transporter n=1 Tax=Campylobacter sp. RM12651 TaxID=1660079 RepID=UPI001EFB318C|nr:multidrug effflux MFS transporter [Campylobacter sp. RM12651]ULO02803.1 drug resistance transporter, Bcr/CflA family [Campylobacter sp. RM12651]